MWGQMREVFPGLDSGPNCSEGHYSMPWKNVPHLTPHIPPGHQDGRSIHFLLNMSNTHLPITLEQNAFVLQNLAQKCSFKPFTIPQTFWNGNLLFTASEF